MRLLLVEDDRIVRITVRDALEDAGYQVTDCASGAEAERRLAAEPWDLMLTDVRLPGTDGVSLFRQASRLANGPSVVLMTAYANVEDAVTVMREGARDYVLKPFEMDELLLRLGRVRDERRLRLEVARTEPAGALARELVGASAVAQQVRERIEAAAASDVGVLLTGETGSGKDLAARLIHQLSKRGAGPLVAVNCAAIPEALFEAEMFGHEKGAFTGADRRRTGRFESAQGGTLFLDEVGDLSLANQARLLRAIETSSFEPVGTSRPVVVDVRVVAATNRDVAAEVARGTFRRDLYYRLNVIDLHLPPLRSRREDIAALTAKFLAEISARVGRPTPALTPSVAAALMAHDYPGNVRELLHALERAVALSRGGSIELAHLPDEIARCGAIDGTGSPPELQPLREAMEQFERQYIKRALEQSGGQRGKAASLLGISRKTLWERLRDVGKPEAAPQEP